MKPSLQTAAAALALALAAPGTPAAETAPATDRLAWFRDAKFGLFIHWGLYAVPAGEWQGKTSHGEWIQKTGNIPCREYDAFAAKFNPVKFDAKQWARAAARAGMRYVVITSKHHDGFSMYDSHATSFDIVDATPYHKDPMKPLADAVRAEGMTFCFYYSVADWHYPDAPAQYNQGGFHGQPKADADSAKYGDFMREQVRELLTGYGPIGILWFDGGGAYRDVDRVELLGVDRTAAMIRELQPACLINARLGVASDFDTPEQYIPGGKAAKPFEVCMTMNGHWGYNRADQNWKSTTTLVRNLIDCVSKGGNYLLNVGPNAEGEIPAPSLERLAEIGRWMDVNGEAIHGAGPSPFGAEFGTVTKKDARGKPQKTEGAKPWRCTSKPGKLYFHLYEKPQGRFVIAGVTGKVKSARALAGGAQLPFDQQNGRVEVDVAALAWNPHATVIVLDLP